MSKLLVICFVLLASAFGQFSDPWWAQGQSVILTRDNFYDYVGKGKHVVVDFLANNAASANLVEEWNKLAKWYSEESPLKDDIVIAVIDGANFNDISEQHLVKNFPDIILFLKGNNQGIRYYGEMTSEYISDWVEDLIALAEKAETSQVKQQQDEIYEPVNADDSTNTDPISADTFNIPDEIDMGIESLSSPDFNNYQDEIPVTNSIDSPVVDSQIDYGLDDYNVDKLETNDQVSVLDSQTNDIVNNIQDIPIITDEIIASLNQDYDNYYQNKIVDEPNIDSGFLANTNDAVQDFQNAYVDEINTNQDNTTPLDNTNGTQDLQTSLDIDDYLDDDDNDDDDDYVDEKVDSIYEPVNSGIDNSFVDNSQDYTQNAANVDTSTGNSQINYGFDEYMDNDNDDDDFDNDDDDIIDNIDDDIYPGDRINYLNTPNNDDTVNIQDNITFPEKDTLLDSQTPHTQQDAVDTYQDSGAQLGNLDLNLNSFANEIVNSLDSNLDSTTAEIIEKYLDSNTYVDDSNYYDAQSNDNYVDNTSSTYEKLDTIEASTINDNQYDGNFLERQDAPQDSSSVLNSVNFATQPDQFATIPETQTNDDINTNQYDDSTLNAQDVVQDNTVNSRITVDELNSSTSLDEKIARIDEMLDNYQDQDSSIYTEEKNVIFDTLESVKADEYQSPLDVGTTPNDNYNDANVQLNDITVQSIPEDIPARVMEENSSVNTPIETHQEAQQTQQTEQIQQTEQTQQTQQNQQTNYNNNQPEEKQFKVILDPTLLQAQFLGMETQITTIKQNLEFEINGNAQKILELKGLLDAQKLDLSDVRNTLKEQSQVLSLLRQEFSANRNDIHDSVTRHTERHIGDLRATLNQIQGQILEQRSGSSDGVIAETSRLGQNSLIFLIGGAAGAAFAYIYFKIQSRKHKRKILID